MKSQTEGKKEIEPSIYKTKVWKEIEKQSKKMPKFYIEPTIPSNKEDVKKAKLMEKILNYEFKHNTNGFQTKYFLLQKKLAEAYTKEMLYGITVRWEDMDKMVKTLAGTNYEK
jgi:ABC-type uncharacterized transport system ATPase subunit